MTYQQMVAAAVLAIVALAGCGSDGAQDTTSLVSDPRVEAVRASFQSLGPASFDEQDNAFWAVDERPGGPVLVRVAADGQRSERTLDATGADREYGGQLVSLEGEMVLARVECASAQCNDARIVVRRFTGSSDGIEEAQAPPSSGVIASPSAIDRSGPSDDGLLLRSDNILLRLSKDAVEESKVSSEIGPVCLVKGQVLGVAYPPSDQGKKDLESPSFPSAGEVGNGWLVSLDGQSASHVAGSDFAYSLGDHREPRCAGASVQLAVPNKGAVQTWDGSGSWHEHRGADPGWRVAPTDQQDLVGLVGNEVVRIDSNTGAPGDRTPIPAAAEQLLKPAADGTPLTPFVTRSHGADGRAAICRTTAAGDQAEVTCEIFS